MTSMPIEEPPKRGLTMYGPSPPGQVGASALGEHEGARQGREARRHGHRPETEFVHAQSGSGRCGAGVGDSSQIQCALEGAVFARASVAAVDQGIELEVALFPTPQHAWLGSEEAAAGLGHKAQVTGALGRPVHERGGLQGGVDGDEALALGPVDGLDVRLAPGQNERPRRLQAGQDAHVVFGRRAAENDSHLF